MKIKITITFSCFQKLRMVSQNVHTKDEIFQKAAVATDNTECSIVGKKILTKGGSAVDAAIAALLCLGR